MKKIVLPVLTLGLAIGGGLALRGLNADVTGHAVGEGGVNAIDAQRIAVDNNWQWARLPDEVLDNGALLTQVTTYKGTDPGNVRFSGGSIKFQEANDGAHALDDIDILSFRGDPSLLGGGVKGETGTVNAAIPWFDSSVPITFARTYNNPVVFAQVTTYHGGQPIEVHAANVTSTGATLILNEPNSVDGPHANEIVHYVVLESGYYPLPDGKLLQVGKQAITTTGKSDFSLVTLPAPYYLEPMVIATVQSNDRNGYVGTRVRKGRGGDDIEFDFEVRFMRADSEEESTTNGTIGYLAYGTPWTLSAGRIVLSNGVDQRGFDFGKKPRGTCFDLTRAGFNNVVDNMQFVTPQGRTSVTLYDDPWCSGDSATFETTASANVGVGNFANKANSMRITWSRGASIYTERDWADEETILQNDDAFLMLREGNLTLFKTNDADGTLWPAWSKGNNNGVRVSWKTNGNFTLEKQNGDNIWSTDTKDKNIDHVSLLTNCDWKLYNPSGDVKFAAGTAGCNAGAPPSVGSVMPGGRIAYADLDHDGSAELLFVVVMRDGTGGIYADPLGVADMLNVYGIGIPDDFWTLLSPTQQALLLSQIPSELGYGNQISGAEMRALIAMLNDQDKDRTYDVIYFHASGSLHAFQASDSAGPVDTTITMGDIEVLVENDEYGPGFELSYTYAQLDVTVGGVMTVSVVGGQAAAASNVDRNGFVIGAQYNVIGAAVVFGNENGSYVGFDAGVGAGFWAAASAGRNGQYGFSLAVPVVPFGVAIYVEGDDATYVYGEVKNWTVGAALDTRDLTIQTWGHASTWVTRNSKDIALRFESVANDTRIAVIRTGNTAVIAVGDTAQAVLTSLSDAAHDMVAGVNQVGAMVGDGFDDITTAVDNWAQTTANVSVRWGGNVVSGGKNLWKKVKFW
ncbi:MAG: hypothetical protein KC620_12335 [Myxococcales bacterium]|nr:hypothetical protein [Myxococcales bacterium]